MVTLKTKWNGNVFLRAAIFFEHFVVWYLCWESSGRRTVHRRDLLLRSTHSCACAFLCVCVFLSRLAKHHILMFFRFGFFYSFLIEAERPALHSFLARARQFKVSNVISVGLDIFCVPITAIQFNTSHHTISAFAKDSGGGGENRIAPVPTVPSMAYFNSSAVRCWKQPPYAAPLPSPLATTTITSLSAQNGMRFSVMSNEITREVSSPTKGKTHSKFSCWVCVCVRVGFGCSYLSLFRL